MQGLSRRREKRERASSVGASLESRGRGTRRVALSPACAKGGRACWRHIAVPAYHILGPRSLEDGPFALRPRAFSCSHYLSCPASAQRLPRDARCYPHFHPRPIGVYEQRRNPAQPADDTSRPVSLLCCSSRALPAALAVPEGLDPVQVGTPPEVGLRFARH